LRVSEHKISKVCKEIDKNKYLPIINASYGYAKLCCYTVKALQNHNITTSYENICVGLWLMFPSAERLHLSGFEDMPDTDFMEKLIKLRSKPGSGNYLTGGNYKGRTSEFGLPWRLTKKGETYAKQADDIIKGSRKENDIAISNNAAKRDTRRGTINYDTQINPILSSNLYKKFQEELDLTGSLDRESSDVVISEQEICSAFGIYYPTYNLKQKVESKKKALKNLLSMMVTDGIISENASAIRLFLKWLDKRKIGYE
jgi:hypothetical protein